MIRTTGYVVNTVGDDYPSSVLDFDGMLDEVRRRVARGDGISVVSVDGPFCCGLFEDENEAVEAACEAGYAQRHEAALGGSR